MKARRIVVMALSVMVGSATGLQAQAGTGRGGGPGWGGRLYDTKTVETVSGEVISVEQVRGKGWGQGRGGRGAGYGVHLVLQTDKEKIAVHLGPSWYLEKQGLTIASGDRLEVRGSRITFDGQPTIIAAEITRGEQSLRLRDDAGLPAWRGLGRRGP